MNNVSEELSFTVDNATIIRLLGNQNFSNRNSAVLELVKNSYDAFASSLIITFSQNAIILKDDGDGMSEDDIRNLWMVVGKSNKQYDATNSSGKSRVLSGSMGIGRFALSKLGQNVEICTKKWRRIWQRN